MLNLLVVRVSDPERSRRWYESLGLRFEQEQHGDGPMHYAAEHDGIVFELYPAPKRMPVSAGVRLGFTVADVEAIAAAMELDGYVARAPSGRDESPRAVLVDPDGIKVEIVQARATAAAPER